MAAPTPGTGGFQASMDTTGGTIFPASGGRGCNKLRVWNYGNTNLLAVRARGLHASGEELIIPPNSDAVLEADGGQIDNVHAAAQANTTSIAWGVVEA